MRFQDVNLTASSDKPEGLIDALMQVAVCEVCTRCGLQLGNIHFIIMHMIPAILSWHHNILHHYQEKVGWRDSSLSRRLVLAITDDEYHYALDGRVAAIVKRHDGECHLDDDGFYTHDTLLVIHNTVLWWSSDCILKLKFLTPNLPIPLECWYIW